MTDDSALVVADHVSRTYGRGPSAVVAVHGTSCRILAGEQIALVGPSGSGKSTLVHLLAGLDTPTNGVIRWPGLGGLPARLPAGSLGLVFQGPSLLPDLDIAENVAFPLVLSGHPGPSARAAAVMMLRELDLADLADKVPGEISGGQAQRVVVARALVARPRLILADEPTGQLDHASAAIVVALLTDRAHELNAGLLVTTHDPWVAAQLEIQWHMIDGRPRFSQAMVP
ncbi:MAG: putative transport system ATP-binding protein [Acidimicrobiaceae bacterium]|nr:putative transport system ATP-binding protein [Acidimicrobiaceae bacterium]